jgi:hypothetical protein
MSVTSASLEGISLAGTLTARSDGSPLVRDLSHGPDAKLVTRGTDSQWSSRFELGGRGDSVAAGSPVVGSHSAADFGVDRRVERRARPTDDQRRNR